MMLDGATSLNQDVESLRIWTEGAEDSPRPVTLTVLAGDPPDSS